MKRLLSFALAAILAIAASAQVNAVGIPFGISKIKAVELLKYKYGDYDDFSLDCITYFGFRLDGVTYESAHFFFDDNMRFKNALFTRPKQKKGEDVSRDAVEIAEILSEKYLVVNLVANDASQEHHSRDVDLLTMFRAAPRELVDGRPPFMIDVVGCFTSNGMYVTVNYSIK